MKRYTTTPGATTTAGGKVTSASAMYPINKMTWQDRRMGLTDFTPETQDLIDPGAHASSGEYMGLDRSLVQHGYPEVDYCSVGKSCCTLQYVKGEACLRVHTQGEQIHAMKVEGWSNACRERRADEQANMLPADIRYLAQWKSDCENFGQCDGIEAYFRATKKKYARDPEVTRVLNTYETSVEVAPRPNR